MAEEKPSLHIDTDWKKQAQEEKQRLAEREQREREQREQRAQQAPAAPGIIAPGLGPAGAVAAPAGGSAPGDATARGGRGQREMPPASFGTLVQSLLTQTLLYLGELATQAGPMLNLDMAKRQVDLLNMLEEKTQNNLNEEEQHTLDAALYEARNRFVSVASQYL